MNRSLVAACLLALTSCAPPAAEFVVLNGWERWSEDTALIDLDYTEAYDSGFVVPSSRQVEGGRFAFELDTQVDAKPGATYHYKFYYLNDSYRFPHADTAGEQHPQAHENFYGSWERASEGFRPVEVDAHGRLVVRDHFRIQGDPREEPGLLDTLGQRRPWLRNPRVGDYRFMLVVIPDDAFSKARPPDPISDIGLKLNGTYVDPFWYWSRAEHLKVHGAKVFVADQRLRVRARPDLGAGVHYNSHIQEAFSAQCGNAPHLTKSAPFEQFIHYVDPATRFANIPLIADVLGNEYTPADHDKYRCLYPEDRMVVVHPTTTQVPCATVTSDPERHLLELRNPASTYGNWRKENVGVRARHGFTYGKYRVKCKLTRLLNDSDMWVGLTNAIWLLYQSEDLLRRSCDAGGYQRDYEGGDAPQRAEQVPYAEIDFELLKTVAYCPSGSFPPLYPQNAAVADDRSAWAHATSDARTDGHGMITVACTNWDMACKQPVDYGAGCRSIQYEGRSFQSHRWDEDYRALTQKTEALDKELFGGTHYWFEIDWRPTEIVWRIGPDLDNLRVVGYMNDEVTAISNVQMQLIITQEFHNTRWWPGTPYDQGFIPFPAKDYVGQVLDVIIE